MTVLSDKPIYRFGDVEVDPSRGVVKRADRELALRQQTFQVLLYLLERRERLVTKEELAESVWRGAAVTDNALVQCVSDIRRALGDDSRRPLFIKTFPKVGYRFTGPVEEIPAARPAAIEIEETTTVEVEFEKEIETEARDDAPARRPNLPPRAPASLRLRAALACVGASSLLATGALAHRYLRPSARADRTAAAIALPQVPGKRSLAVMYFENQSQSADLDWLREGLADMLITGLSRSANLSTLDRGQLRRLLERAGHDPRGGVNREEALDVARGVQAETVALGSFAYLDGQLRVDVKLYDARTGEMLAAEHVLAERPGQILSAVDILSLKLAAHLGVTPAGHNAGAGLAGVMTNNLEAYRYYSLAVEKAHGMRTAEAIELLERAVALDPQFAMAHARIGYAYAVTWYFADKAKPHLERAFRLSGRLTDKDRLHIAAWYSIAHRDYEGAIKSFREIVAKYPLEIEAHLRLAHLLRGEERMDEAAEVCRRALAIDAGAKEFYNSLGMIYAELGRHDEAINMFRRYVELAPGEPNAYDSLGMGYQWAGRYGEAVQAYERALALDPEFEIARVHLGNTYFQQGRYREAVAEYRRYLEAAPSNAERARGYNSIAIVYWKKGELNEAARAAQRSVSYNRQERESSFFVALARGDLAAAAKIQEELRGRRYHPSRGARISARVFHYTAGSLDLKSGRAAEAVEHFRAAVRHRPLIWHVDSFEDCLADAYLELGRFDEAVEEYERVLRLNPSYPLAHYRLARAYEQKGEQEKARDAYERFLQTWKEADANLPEVADARNRLTLAR